MIRILEHIKKQILSNRKNSIFLLSLVALFAFVLVAGNVINTSLTKGIGNIEKRLGADIMIVPSGSRSDAENIILTGQRSNFYFDNSIYQNILDIDGIENITAQCYLKSLAADCCSAEVQIVFFDPETDFIVEPWIEKEYSESLNKNEVIVGYGVEIEDGTITLFNHDYVVVAQLSQTGTSIDNSVYFTFDSKDELLNYAEASNSFLTEEQKEIDLISSIYINVTEDADVNTVIANCHLAAGSDFDVVYPKQLSASLSSNLKFILNTINVVMMLAEAIIVLIIVIINHLFISKRKQEIAILRVFGNTKRRIIGMLLSEVDVVGFFGAIIGIFLAWLIVIPFGNYIGYSLMMPYLGPNPGEVVLRSVVAIIFVLIVTSLSSVFSIIRVVNMGIYEALRREAE